MAACDDREAPNNGDQVGGRPDIVHPGSILVPPCIMLKWDFERLAQSNITTHFNSV